MTTEIKKSAPPPVPPRHNKEYYEEDEKPTKKFSIPPVTPKRISSRLSGTYEKNTIFKDDEQTVEKNSSTNTLLLDNKEFDTSTLENEIMNDLNHLSDHFK